MTLPSMASSARQAAASFRGYGSAAAASSAMTTMPTRRGHAGLVRAVKRARAVACRAESGSYSIPKAERLEMDVAGQKVRTFFAWRRRRRGGGRRRRRCFFCGDVVLRFCQPLFLLCMRSTASAARAR